MSTLSEPATARRQRTDTAVELLAALAVVVLTILGLAKVTPTFVVAVATIVFGIALLLQGRAAASDIGVLVRGNEGSQALYSVGTGGWTTVLLAGTAGVVLGILALLQIESVKLIAIAIIGFGGALMLSANSMVILRLTRFSMSNVSEPVRMLVENLAMDAAGMQTAVGLAAVVLGILALSGFASVTLVLIALLALGGMTLAGSTFASQGLMGRLQ